MSRTVYATARELLIKVRASGAGAQRIRLLGVRLEGLVPSGEVSEQLELGSADSGPGWREAQGAIDRALEKFGMTAVRPAALLDRPDVG